MFMFFRNDRYDIMLNVIQADEAFSTPKLSPFFRRMRSMRDFSRITE